jgi:hypothetical protein
MLAYMPIEFVVSEGKDGRLVVWIVHELQVHQFSAGGRRHAHSRVECLDVY